MLIVDTAFIFIYINFSLVIEMAYTILLTLDELDPSKIFRYIETNVVISGIHSHSSPIGYLQCVVYIIIFVRFVKCIHYPYS